MNSDLLRQRVSHTTCARCRKLFKAGDRVQQAFIVLNPDTRNPATQERVAEMSMESEFVHASCLDPSLDGRVILAS